MNETLTLKCKFTTMDAALEGIRMHRLLLLTITIMALATTRAQAIDSLTFGDVDFDGTTGSVELLWSSSNETLAGIQFDLMGATVDSIGGGLVDAYDWTLYHNEVRVIGFTAGQFIPPQPIPEVLIVLDFTAEEGSTLSFEGVVFANPEAQAIELDASDTITLNACPGDLDGNGATNVNDLLAVIAAWNTDASDGDADGSGFVDVADLLIVISEWGPC